MNKLKQRRPFDPTGAAACQFDRQRNFPRPHFPDSWPPAGASGLSPPVLAAVAAN